MSQLAGQLIMSPKISQSLAVLATTVGRDKAYRLIQYLSRLIAWSLLRKGSIDSAARFEGIKTSLANVRRALRLFRPAEFMQSVVKLASKPITNLQAPGQIAHVSQIVKQLLFATYYGSDMLVWLAQAGAIKYEKEQLTRIQRLSQKAWLFGIASSLISSSASMIKLRADSRRYMLSREVARREAAASGPADEKADRVKEEEERRERGRALLQQRQQILTQLIMDSCDIWVPATALGYSNLNDGVVGLLGAFTSYMSLQGIWLKHAAAGARKDV